MINIKNEALFKSKLLSGISIFAGAGFSVLKDPDGHALPTGQELKQKVIDNFDLSDVTEDDDLDYISEFCSESDYQKYLRKEFTVSGYNPLYDALNLVSIKAFVTTNIDNIIRLVAERSPRYYLKNMREEGACVNRTNELVYIPLHGDVLDESSKLYFGKFDLSSVRQNNSDLFDAMRGILSMTPILFWGYSFNDTGVLSIIKELVATNHSNIWVQVRPTDQKNKRLFENKGCNIIEANTDELLEWIGSVCSKPELDTSSIIDDSSLAKYRVPALSQVTKIPAKDFYQQGITDWAPIISRVPYERSIVSEAENKALENKNVILSGPLFSGKTTALMQLSKKIDSENILYINEATKNEADFIIKKIGKTETWVLFNNCCSDVDAFIAFAKVPNIKLIGAADDYQLETVKHILAISVNYKVIDCTDITRNEAINMYNNVAVGLRRPSFSYKQENDEKYTIFEFISNNIDHAYTRRHVSNLFGKIKEQDWEVFVTIMAAAYFSLNSSAISYQIISHILDVDVYPEAYDVIKRATNYLRLFNVDFDHADDSVDYYILRSKVFLQMARKILVEDFRNEYAELIEAVVLKVNPYTIPRYDSFKRKAYDSILFKELFSYDKAIQLYNKLYSRDENPYTLQQLALCQSLFADYDGAFVNIDRALSAKPDNFSFKNSQAIIMFEANHNNRVPGSIDYLKKSMVILEECYANDKRKLYHAQKYAEFAIILSREYDCNDYLEKAVDWLMQMTRDDVPDSLKTKRLKEKLSGLLSIS